jgi:hypothetical protein
MTQAILFYRRSIQGLLSIHLQCILNHAYQLLDLKELVHVHLLVVFYLLFDLIDSPD